VTTIDRSNPLSSMLDNAFTKFDRNKDGKLDTEEFRPFYEILKPGIALDKDKKPTISEQEYQGRMDHNSDGGVTRTEMQSTGVLMPASLTDDSLNSMMQYLLKQQIASAQAAAGILAENDAPSTILSEKKL
jgi:Ca2+-binding EF-hand superfamily protein